MWNEMSSNALINGTGVVVYSLCNECAPSIIIRDGKYCSNFCQKCNKRTFAMKYPGHVEKYVSSFYEMDTESEEKKSLKPENGRSWKEMVPCSVTGRGAVVTVVLAACCKPTLQFKHDQLFFNFCMDCQKRTGWAKYPKLLKASI